MRPRHTILATLLLVTWVTSHASAQQTAGSTAVTGEILAPVVIDGEQLFLVQGISAYRAGNQPYTAEDQGDAMRALFDVRFGMIDRGPISVASATGLSIQNETYTDGAKTNMVSFGTTWRVFYDRTYGINVGVNKRLKYEFTDATGTLHEIPSDLGYNVLLVYRQAMNFAWEFGFSNTQSLRLGENYRNGWSWNLQWHFLY